jgi:hypothetical protein
MLNWNSQERLRSWETNERKKKDDRGGHRWEENSPACPKFKQLLLRNILNNARERGQAGRKGEKKDLKKHTHTHTFGDLKTAIVNS